MYRPRLQIRHQYFNVLFLQELRNVLLRLTDEGRQYQAVVTRLTTQTAQLLHRNEYDVCDKLS